MKGFKHSITIMAILTLGVGVGIAQNFTLDSSTIDGGGGESSGGPYTLSGTIGQPDTGKSSSKPYAMAGGFWGLYGSFSSPEAPDMSISYDPELDEITVSWELPAKGWLLDESPMLGLGAFPWEEVPEESYQSNATHRFVTVSSPTGSNFFRLRLP